MSPRVAHVISARGLAGAERFLTSLVVAGHERGWDQLVLNPFANESFTDLSDLCQPVQCEGRRCDRVLELPSVRQWLRRQLTSFRPDIVHALLFHSQVLTASLPRSPGTSRLLTNVSGDWARSAHGPLTRHVDRLTGDRFDRVVAISDFVRQFLVSDYGFPESKVTCIPLGWTGDPQPAKREQRRPTIICVGVLRPEKCHDVLLDALPLVQRDVPAARLVLVGDGPLRPSLEARVNAEGLRDSVAFLGRVADVWSHLADADVFAIASRSEAFCIAVAEAMASGLPVVAPDVGAIPELVRSGVTGELFPPGDHRALAHHLVRILRSPDLRSAMGAAAKEAAESLRLERAFERYFEVYEELLEAAGRPPLDRHPRASA